MEINQPKEKTVDSNKGNHKKAPVAISKLSSYATLLIGFGIILGSLVFSYFTTYAFYKKHQKNLELIKVENLKMQRLNKKISQLQKAKSLAGSIQENNSLTLEAVPAEDDIPIVMSMIQKMAKNSAVKISTLSYAGLEYSDYAKSLDKTANSKNMANSNTKSTTKSKSKKSTLEDDEQYDSFKVNVIVSGRFEDALKFIKSLENSRRLIDVLSFNYNLKKDNNLKKAKTNRDILSVKVLARSYYKDFSKTNSQDIELDKYLPIISKLENMEYIDIDTSNVVIGKNNPFLQGSDNNTSNSKTDSSKSGESNFFEINSLETGVETKDLGVTNGGSSSNSSQNEQDVEAEKGDTTQVLLDLLKQEGLQ